MRKKLLLLAFLSVWLWIPLAYGIEDPLNFTNFPEYLAYYMNISIFAGQLIATLILTLPFVISAGALSRNLLIGTITGVLCLFVAYAFGWVGIWLPLVTILVVGLVYYKRITGEGLR